MKPTYRSIALQSGQMLAFDGRAGAPMFLAEGEVLLQDCAGWIGEGVVVPRPRRIAAPAALEGREVRSMTAVGAARILVQEPVTLSDRLKSSWKEFRLPWARALRP